MRVQSFQLVPGCVLLKDIKGRTNKPIIPKKTVLTDEHITIIHKFLVETVDVSKTLADGKPFQPEVSAHKQENTSQIPSQTSADPFLSHYKQTVNHYKELFLDWQNNAAINIPSVRKVLIPFFETVDQIGLPVYTLYQYADKEDFIFHRSVSVGTLSAFLAQKLGYENGEWLQIGLAGVLSDCGMAKVNEAMVMQNSPLTVSELGNMKKHPAYSYRMIERLPAVSQAVKLAVLQHHERLDGTGYPLGLTAEKIHSYSRIIAVCDTYYTTAYEGMNTENRSLFNAIEKLQKDQFTKLDHQVVQVFIDTLITFLTGRKVQLSTGQTGEIVYVEKEYPTRPMIKLDDSDDILPLRNYPAITVSVLR